jgi:hypothetical protein
LSASFSSKCEKSQQQILGIDSADRSRLNWSPIVSKQGPSLEQHRQCHAWLTPSRRKSSISRPKQGQNCLVIEF